MTPIRPIRVVVADSWSVVRAGLGAILRTTSDLHLVGEASDAEEALQLCHLVEPDIILVDLNLLDMDSFSLMETICARWPKIKILALFSHQDNELLEKAVQVGASGALHKGADADEVVSTLRQVFSGKKPSQAAELPPETIEDLVERMTQDLDTIVIDITRLSELLHQYLPKILPRCQSEVIMFPQRTLFAFPNEHLKQVPEHAWNWLRSRPEACIYSSGEETPWGENIGENHTLALVPVPSASGREVLGAIGVLSGPGAQAPLADSMPILHSLARQISKAIEKALLHGVRSSRHNLAEELAMAGRIQAEILPARAPQLRGWDISARLVPALETSGDFYDFIRLSNNNLGIVIADVSDKGMGAALFMALSNTLIRTYATQYSTLPSFALGIANERILLDTRSGMFVTAFYGVLEPDTGRMRYVNAGHNPPYMFSTQKNKTIDWLRSTGMALGVMEDTTWGQKMIKFSPGDVLLLYTDGITDAQDRQGRYYGEKRLQDVVRSMGECSANAILDALLKDLQRFTGGMPQQDDITLVVVCRQAVS